MSTLKAKEIAAKLMQTIMFDNGFTNTSNPEKYPLEHVEEIAKWVEQIEIENPGFEFDDEVIEALAAGDRDDLNQFQMLVSDYNGALAQLMSALNVYFKNAPLC